MYEVVLKRNLVALNSFVILIRVSFLENTYIQFYFDSQGQNEVSQLVGNLIEEYRNRKERFLNTQQQSSKTKLPTNYPPLRCLQLHGSLPQHEQLRIFERPTRSCRKVIVATNVAEASVTIPGISYVIDCGFSRIRAYNPVNGLEALVTIPTSQASARQRAGRAGRTRTGQVSKIWLSYLYLLAALLFTSLFHL